MQGGGREQLDPLEGAAAVEPALWVHSKMLAFHTFQGIVSFSKFQLRKWDCSQGTCPLAKLLQRLQSSRGPLQGTARSGLVRGPSRRVPTPPPPPALAS